LATSTFFQLSLSGNFIPLWAPFSGFPYDPTYMVVHYICGPFTTCRGPFTPVRLPWSGEGGWGVCAGSAVRSYPQYQFGLEIRSSQKRQLRSERHQQRTTRSQDIRCDDTVIGVATVAITLLQ